MRDLTQEETTLIAQAQSSYQRYFAKLSDRDRARELLRQGLLSLLEVELDVVPE
jgi:hypothetical protein